MSFYGLIEKLELQVLINKAKESYIKDAKAKLKNFDAMNETFFKAAMPNDTPNILIKKRTNKTNKLLKKKREKELKRLLG